MSELKGEVFRVRQTRSGNLGLGRRLSELRTLAGLTQSQMAKRLGVTGQDISNLESQEDTYVSTLREYVEALGASLHIDARFNAASTMVSTISDVFDVEFGSEDQLVLPLYEDEKHRSQKDFVLSIRPEFSEQILDGRKTVELRRRFPLNVPDGTLAFIYTTSPRRALTGIARISHVEKMPKEEIWETFGHTAGIDKAGFDNYFSGLEIGYSIVFSKVKRLSRSLELDELREKFHFQPPQSFLYAKPVFRELLKHDCFELVD